MSRSAAAVPLALVLALAAGCASSSQAPLTATDRDVDLERFSGDWYVLAHIPVTIPFFDESDAFDAVETYELAGDGDIDVTYRFHRGAFDGPVRVMEPSAWVYDDAADGVGTNAEWRVQFVWPFRAAYLIAWLDDDYTRTIIGVPSRDYVWLMSRDPVLDDAEYDALVGRITDLGYDTTELRKIPQRPLDERE